MSSRQATLSERVARGSEGEGAWLRLHACVRGWLLCALGAHRRMMAECLTHFAGMTCRGRARRPPLGCKVPTPLSRGVRPRRWAPGGCCCLPLCRLLPISPTGAAAPHVQTCFLFSRCPARQTRCADASLGAWAAGAVPCSDDANRSRLQALGTVKALKLLARVAAPKQVRLQMEKALRMVSLQGEALGKKADEVPVASGSGNSPDDAVTCS